MYTPMAITGNYRALGYQAPHDFRPNDIRFREHVYPIYIPAEGDIYTEADFFCGAIPHVIRRAYALQMHVVFRRLPIWYVRHESAI